MFSMSVIDDSKSITDDSRSVINVVNEPRVGCHVVNELEIF